MHATDPAFAETEMASHVLPFPFVGLHSRTTPERRPSVDSTTDLVFNFADPERVRRERSMLVTATRERERLQTEANMRIAEAASAAYQNGKADGRAEREREGWTTAVSWGVFCGAFGTCVVVALAVIGMVLYVGRRVPLF